MKKQICPVYCWGVSSFWGLCYSMKVLKNGILGE
jgi:hypothetical protein